MKFPCPVCKETKEIRINRRGKPFLRCDQCGVLLFVNRKRGIETMTNGMDVPYPVNEKTESLASYFDRLSRG